MKNGTLGHKHSLSENLKKKTVAISFNFFYRFTMAAGGGTSKEIKGLLKNGREAIRSKEYKEALKLCKVGLQSME